MTSAAPALALENVSKRFGRRTAVDDLSFQVEQGHLAGFLGPNGAGKSTTLYMIPRLLRPTSGRLSIFDVDIWKDYKRAIRSVGISVETAAFYEYLSGRKNLELTARLLGNVSPAEIDEILERIGLADRQNDRVQVYSTGMKQRLGIGRALLGHPRLLILDEPTNGMDPEGTYEILSFLREKVRQDGLTIFVSSHLMSEVEEFCDTVCIINHGHLVASGSVRELLKPHERIVRVTFQSGLPDQAFLASHPEIRKTEFITQDTMEITLARDDSAWLNHCLLQGGFAVSALAPKQKTLKEFFLSITGDNPQGAGQISSAPSPGGEGRDEGGRLFAPLPSVALAKEETRHFKSVRRNLSSAPIHMASPFLALLRNEITKAARRKLPYFGLFAASLICVVAYFLAGQSGSAPAANAWNYVGFSMQMVSSDIGPICILAFTSMLVAEETGSGTIRSALAAPIYRWEFYLAKAVLGLLYMIVLSAVILTLSVAFALIHYRFGAVSDSYGPVFSQRQVLEAFLLGYGLSWIPLSALVMFGLFISTLVRSPGAAVAASISLLMVINLTKHLTGLDPYIFTRYIDFSWLALQQIGQGIDFPWQPEVWRMITLSGLSAGISFIAGLILFVRQDLNH
jgi:ABC-2 type transport system ATP-binding protein